MQDRESAGGVALLNNARRLLLSPYPLVSVVILNYNGRELLRNCLKSILKSNYPNFEIIVVDNGSNDGSQTMIKKEFPQVKLIANKVNLGYGQGNNIGIRNSRGELVLFLNNDIILNPDCIKILVNKAQLRKDTGILGCKIYLGYLNKVIQHAGGKLDSSGSGILIGYFERDNGQYDQESEVDWVHGAAFVVKKSLFKEIGQFDQIYHPIYHDEIDLCYRAKISGYQILYIPSAIAYHFENISPEKIYKTAFYRIRNTLIFACKYYSAFKLLLLPFSHIKTVVNGLRSPKYQNRPKLRTLDIAISYVNAFAWILKFLPLVLQHRYSVKQKIGY